MRLGNSSRRSVSSLVSFIDTPVPGLLPSSSPSGGGAHETSIFPYCIRRGSRARVLGQRAAAGDEESEIPVDLAGEPDAAGQLQVLRRAGQIGRASCRERVWISGVAESFK